MEKVHDLAEEIRKTGFQCLMCGGCCARGEDDGMLVLVSAPEIRAIMDHTGLAWDEIAEPYPEWIPAEGGGEFTLAWCLRRTEKACIFLDEQKRCTIYPARPLICRTYPFALEEGSLSVYACPGTGHTPSCSEAETLAEECIRRDSAETKDAERTREIFMTMELGPNEHAVVDSEGVKRIWVK
ncbi:YkgJ family cysteine cluster protein [Methanogenium organophilum]|uniref:YkgJ family cysteine cluster protein n=1 Tax=Methanogenium organophilum TaxID=2199 RepID=A0A9X9S2Z3_METOG|nr:YkgJ family cysteine cluster protein [Methanogenium organophilum]WAI00576.1 YkgJ family cysteine cluster protein [Methanogenium organophilum]